MVGYTQFQCKTYDVNRMNTNTTVKVLAQQPTIQIGQNAVDSTSRDSGEDDTYTDSNIKLNTNAVRAHYKLLISEPINSSLLLYATPLFVKVLAQQSTVQIRQNVIDSAYRDSGEDDTHTDSKILAQQPTIQIGQSAIDSAY